MDVLDTLGSFGVVGFTVELLPERIDLISLILQIAGAGALVIQLAAPLIGMRPERAAQVGSVGAAAAGSAFGFVLLSAQTLG